ncbi:linear amide C-N hydrolase, partial [Faecalibaculum rodentium]|uniref:linear amide C-N hydrolase n=1 Tax=Faecalibaculum rodentium TaxID=1702221 RepID=UPI0026F2CEB8
DYPHNRIRPDVTVPVYSSGMGSDGLPGGLDSMSRFVRAAFMLNSSKAADTEEATVNQFFRIMQTVEQIKGANREKDGFDEITNYTAGADLETMDFYWTTYDNQQINALHTRAQDLDSNTLLVYPVSHDQNIHWIG